MNKSILETLSCVPLEDSDIYQLMGNHQKVLQYSALKNYESILDLLPNVVDSCILLYELQQNVGHWVCVRRINNEIYYFDSYGGKPDTPLSWSKNTNKLLGQGQPFLTELFKKSPIPVYINTVKYQNMNRPDITTCGLWCVAFIKSELDLNLFKKWIDKLKKKYKLTNDELITKIMIQSSINQN